ncbi:brix domain-containing protein [Cavenderia fasciculata]|uniref:Brix domain-containing protein n=1 Tax=Cavenderia fasciculata TaxID=261658 RepID=F4PTC4_CACFS|nr:brix domain-containing protein [Cavenderia fasciculata]EGG21646.1 brix domain-containing protein [Cavenderia fasciculata]|eukprot:XP_004359496.1 brix domain-containing protein [Cavenderia fasciculata]
MVDNKKNNKRKVVEPPKPQVEEEEIEDIEEQEEDIEEEEIEVEQPIKKQKETTTKSNNVKKQQQQTKTTTTTTAVATKNNNNNNNNNVDKKTSKPATKKQLEKEMEKQAIEDPIFKKKRVLILATRGGSSKNRHLMNDLCNLIPHSKREQKVDNRNALSQINDTCEMKGCNYAMLFDNRRDNDLYLWIAKAPLGPTIKFSVSNVHTLDELQMTGNCLKGSRPYLHFDTTFNNTPHLQLTRELLTQVFSTPKGHAKSKPFFDHVFSFFYQDGRVWFRNYQISDHEFKNERLLTEIGPRMILEVNKIFSGGFSGQLLYNNPNFVSPRNQRRDRKLFDAYATHKKNSDRQKGDERKAGAFVDASEIDSLFD